MAAAYIKLYLKDLGEVRVIVNDKYLPHAWKSFYWKDESAIELNSGKNFIMTRPEKTSFSSSTFPSSGLVCCQGVQTYTGQHLQNKTGPHQNDTGH